MVRTAGTPLAPDSLNEMPEPTWRSLLQRGLPQFGIESIVPVVVFYGAWKLLGLAGAVVCATFLSLAIAGWQIRRERGGALAVATAIFVVIQALVALAAHSATIYLAQPVVLSACWSLVYFGSVIVGRPLIGVFANAWYPFPPSFARVRRTGASSGCSRSSGASTASGARRFGSSCCSAPASGASSSCRP